MVAVGGADERGGATVVAGVDGDSLLQLGVDGVDVTAARNLDQQGG
jgi:hypothetical protein